MLFTSQTLQGIKKPQVFHLCIDTELRYVNLYYFILIVQINFLF